MFEDFGTGSDWGQMFDGTGLGGTTGGGGLAGALGSAFGSDGVDYGSIFDGSGLEGGAAGDAAGSGALSQVLDGGSPNVGGTGDAEALKLLGQGEAPASNALSKIGKLFQDKSGDLDLGKILKVGLGVSSFVNGISNRNKQADAQKQQALQQQLQQAKGQWSPQQAQWANNFFQTPRGNPGVQYASEMRSPITPGVGYASGGEVSEQTIPGWGAPETFPQSGGASGGEPEQMGALGLVHGEGGGQDDMVEARLSPGEYVFDADTVSLIGDGSNDAGAKKLDMWRQALREHKRAAPADEIPPPADDPSAYLPQGEE